MESQVNSEIINNKIKIEAKEADKSARNILILNNIGKKKIKIIKNKISFIL